MSEDTDGGQINTDSTADTQTDAATESTILSGDTGDTGDINQEGAEGSEAEGEGSSEVPESYEFKLPDGVEFSEEGQKEVAGLYSDLGLTQTQADKLTDFYTGMLMKNAGEEDTAFADQLETWATELKNDQEVGGDNFNQNVSIARRTIDKFGSPELRELMDETGVGNHPAMFKFSLAIGKLLAEDQPGSGQSAQPETSIEQRMYPSESKAS